MKIIIDEIVDEELNEFLLTQEGIEKVEIKEEEYSTIIEIKYNNKITTPNIILNYIELFIDNKNSFLLEFDKQSDDYKQMTYKVEDLCCEYCYKGYVEDLFAEKEIISVTSNHKFPEPYINTDFEIKYNNLKEDELKDILDKKLEKYL